MAIHNVVEVIEQLKDGQVYATVVFYSDDGTDFKERWQTVVQPPTVGQLTELVTDHQTAITAKIVDPVSVKLLAQLQGTEIPVK